MLVLLLCQAGIAQVVPENRLATWNADTVGIPGGIPHRETIYATLNPGDNIQTAINSCPVGQVVKLNDGTWDISGLTITKSVTLRGNGPERTILRYNGGNGITIESGVLSGGESALNLSSGYTQGSSNVVTATTSSNLRVGYVVLLDQLNDESYLVYNSGNNGKATWISRESGNRCRSQAVMVTAISGNNVSFWPPLTYDLDATKSPQLYFRHASSTANNYVNWAGVEDLTLTNRSTSSGTGFYINRANYCWLSNVVHWDAYSWHVSMMNGFRNEIRHSTFRGTRTTLNGAGYGISLDNQTCSTLIEDNIIADNRQFVQVNGGGTGNVVAYNYMTNAVASSSAPNYTVKTGGHHNAHPMFNLFEGNIAYKFTGDFTWGSSSHNTFLRNWAKALMPYSSQSGTAFEMDEKASSYNFIGNILGFPSITSHSGFTTFTTLKVSPSTYSYDNQYASFRLGYYSSSDGGGGRNGTNEYQSHIINGNYDYVVGTQTYFNGQQPGVIPASYFHASKPAYFGSLPWPPIDPANPSASIVETNIPAGYRWRYGVDPGQATDNNPPVVIAATVNATGTTLSIVFDETTTGNTGFTLNASGGAATLSSPGGNDTSGRTFTISRAINPGEVVTLNYVPGAVVDAAGNALASFAGFSVVNNSTFDSTAPTPNPATFAANPAPVTATRVTLTATTGSDPAGGIEYQVEVNGVAGDWTASPLFVVSGLDVYSTNYFRVRSRDGNQNVTAWSAFAGCTTFTQAVFSTSATFVCPVGVTNVVAEVWGGGAGGGNVSATARQSGGPGGAYARQYVATTPLTAYAVTVGAGGSPGDAGGPSWFVNPATVLAVGGTNESLGVPGMPGQASSSVGAVRFSGGSYGGRSDTDGETGGGGGGGSPGYFGLESSANGNDGTATAGGAGGVGEGTGGNGGGPFENGGAGQAPGGGGGGHGGSTASLVSGAGGDGRVVIAWQVPNASNPVGNLPPVVVVAATPQSGPAPLTVAFSSVGTYDPEGNALSYIWTFGDGTSSTTANPGKTYSAAGTYAVQLTASDGVNSTDSAILTITVGTTVIIDEPPVAVASASPTLGVAPLVVTFSSAGSFDPEGANLSYSWDFGDGTSSTSANPVHTYQSAGTYGARLSVSDGQKSTQSGIMTITATSSSTDSIAGSTFVDFEAGEDGTVITAAIAASATKGQVFPWQTSSDSGTYSAGSTPNLKIATAAQYNLFTPANINGTLYSGAGVRGMRATQSADNFLVLTFPAPVPKLSVGFYFRWNGPAINWAPRDIFGMTDSQGRYQFLQIYDNASGSQIPYFHTHWQPYTSGNGIGNNVNFQRNRWYWVTMAYATGGGTFRIRFYDAQNNYTLAGESTASIASGPVGATKIVMGQVKYASGGSQSLDFDNFIINTNGVFPLGPGSGGTLPGNQPPVVIIAATPQSGASPLTVAFSSAGTYDPEGGTLSYSWTFGDGTSSTAANPSKTYNNVGNYTARLTVTDGVNSVTSANLSISVIAPPAPPQGLRVVGL